MWCINELLFLVKIKNLLVWDIIINELAKTQTTRTYPESFFLYLFVEVIRRRNILQISFSLANFQN